MQLTNSQSTANIAPPRNIEGGFSGSFPKGDNTPIIKSVFLCLPFFTGAMSRLKIQIMTALFWQPFWLVVPFGDTANQLNAVTRFLAVLRDGFTLQSKGITA